MWYGLSAIECRPVEKNRSPSASGAESNVPKRPGRKNFARTLKNKRKMGTTVVDRDVPDLFAEYRPKILEMRLSDPSFAELWADYCEIFDALEPINGETTELGWHAWAD
jgi:hypothetical protein